MLAASATQPGLAMSLPNLLWLAGGAVVTVAVLGAALFWTWQESRTHRAGRDVTPPREHAAEPPRPASK